MGKYTRKPKLTPQVSVMEMSNSSIGVRTRSKTLALQHLQLEKPNSFSGPNKQVLGLPQTQNSTRVGLDFSAGSAQLDSFVELEGHEDEQLRENDLGFQQVQRAIRKTTPCDLVRDVDNISTPGSSTRTLSLTAESRRPRSSILTNIPSTREMDELFAHLEQQQQRFFMEKYNFDIINDTPLPGRYEWVEVNL